MCAVDEGQQECDLRYWSIHKKRILSFCFSEVVTATATIIRSGTYLQFKLPGKILSVILPWSRLKFRSGTMPAHVALNIPCASQPSLCNAAWLEIAYLRHTRGTFKTNIIIRSLGERENGRRKKVFLGIVTRL